MPGTMIPARLAAASLVGVIGFATSNCGTSSPTNPSQVARADLDFCLSETNQYRSQVGAAPLVRDADVEAFALEAAKSDAASGVPHDYYSRHFPGYSAENEAIRWAKQNHGGTVRGIIRDAIAMAWDEGPGGGHYRNLTGAYTRLGCGVYVDGDIVSFAEDFR